MSCKSEQNLPRIAIPAHLSFFSLTELQNQLQSLLSKGLQSPLVSERHTVNASCPSGDVEKENKGAMGAEESLYNNGKNFPSAGGSELNGELKRKRTETEFAPAWSYCEVPTGRIISFNSFFSVYNVSIPTWCFCMRLMFHSHFSGCLVSFSFMSLMLLKKVSYSEVINLIQFSISSR